MTNIFIFLIYIIPGLYFLFLGETSDHYGASFVSLFLGCLLLYINKNIHKQKVRDFILNLF